MKQLTIRKEFWEQICAHVNASLPEEACGLLAGKDEHVDEIYTVPNMLHSPIKYRMDPEDQLRAFLEIERGGMELIGIFHSHPTGPAHPSETDIAEAYYPDSAYVIVSPGNGYWIAHGYLIDSLMVKEIPLNIIEDI